MGYYQNWTGSTTVIVSPRVFDQLVEEFKASDQSFQEPAYQLYLTTDDPMATQEQLDALDATNTMGIHNLYESRQADESIQKILSIFIYGFITLITLISIANIFNTISTSISLIELRILALANFHTKVTILSFSQSRFCHDSFLY